MSGPASMTTILTGLVEKMADAIDNHPRLTRESFSMKGFKFRPELRFSSEGWVAECEIRSEVAKGKGARTMFTHSNNDWAETPEAAVESFLSKLWAADEVLSNGGK